MKQAEVTATFGPAPGDRATLSKASSATIDRLYQHPLSHNLEWSEVIALFGKLGSATRQDHNEIAFSIAGEHHRVRKPHGKDLTTADVMRFRHMLTRAGWSPQAAGSQDGLAAAPNPAATPPDMLAVIAQDEARLYELDIGSPRAGDHVIRPSNLHHLVHTSRSEDQGHQPPKPFAFDHAFYERIAEAMQPGGRIVLVGHGKGHSNAAHGLAEYLRAHHPGTSGRVVCEVVADLSSLTAPQLLELGRRALTGGEAAGPPA